MRGLLGNFAFGFVGGVFDFGVKAFKQAFDEGVSVGFGMLDLLGQGDVAREVGENNAPGEGVFPSAGADADVLALLGDPDAEDFERGLVAGGGGWDVELFRGCHLLVSLRRSSVSAIPIRSSVCKSCGKRVQTGETCGETAS